MSFSHILSRTVVGMLAFIASVVLSVSVAHADPTLTFDPAMSGTGGSDGGGTWDTEITSDWYDPSTGMDTTFPSYADGPGVANFDNVGGTVDVNGNVSPVQIVFGGSGTYTLSPDAVNGGSITLTPGPMQGYYDTNLIAMNSGSAVIDAPITINEGVDVGTPDNTAIGQVGFTNNGSGNLTINGGVDITNSAGNVFFILNTYGSGSIVDNSAFTGVSPGLIIAQGNSSEFTASANANGAQLDAGSGNFLIDTDNVTGNYSGLIGQSGAILLNGPITVGTGINQFTRYGGTFGGATPDDSTFSGSIQNYAGAQNLDAAAGGKVNFVGEPNQGNNNAGTGNNLVIGATGTGVVSLNNPTGQTYGYRTSGSNSDVGTEIAGGTLLLMNTSGSATGNGAVGTVNNTVQLDAGAGLGGTGSTAQEVMAVGSSSIITPGDMNKEGVSSIGTLHLDNGLSATSGLIFKMDLNGTGANDMVALSLAAVGAPADALTLAGPVTFDFTNLGGSLGITHTFTFLTSAAGTPWDISGATFDFSGPDGYIVKSYGVVNTPTAEDFNVTFVIVPEPTTWALMFGGLSFLVALGHFRRGAQSKSIG